MNFKSAHNTPAEELPSLLNQARSCYLRIKDLIKNPELSEIQQRYTMSFMGEVRNYLRSAGKVPATAWFLNYPRLTIKGLNDDSILETKSVVEIIPEIMELANILGFNEEILSIEA